MYNKNYLFAFLLIFSGNTFICNASNSLENEFELRNRKKPQHYTSISIYEPEVTLTSNFKFPEETYGSIFQSKALEKFVSFCIEKRINFNLKEILDDIGVRGDSLEDYEREADYNKKILAHYHVPEYLLDDLYEDIVRMILKQRNETILPYTKKEEMDPDKHTLFVSPALSVKEVEQRKKFYNVRPAYERPKVDPLPYTKKEEMDPDKHTLFVSPALSVKEVEQRKKFYNVRPASERPKVDPLPYTKKEEMDPDKHTLFVSPALSVKEVEQRKKSYNVSPVSERPEINQLLYKEEELSLKLEHLSLNKKDKNLDWFPEHSLENLKKLVSLLNNEGISEEALSKLFGYSSRTPVRKLLGRREGNILTNDIPIIWQKIENNFDKICKDYELDKDTILSSYTLNN